MTGTPGTISSRGHAPSCSPSDCGTTNTRTVGGVGLIHLVEAAATALTELVGDSGVSLVEEWAKKDCTAANSSSCVSLPTTAGAGSSGIDSSVQDVVSVSSARSNSKNSRPPAMISDDDDAASESSSSFSSSSSNRPSGSLTLTATTTTTTSPMLEKTRSAPAATSDTTSSISIGASAAVAASSSSTSQSESLKPSKINSSSSSSSSLSQSFPPSSPASNTSSSRGIFPQRLMAILSDRSFSDVISWSPHGRSFVVIKTDEFTERVLPQFMSPQQQTSDQQQSPQQQPAAAKYPSFTRKLNRWGFRLVSRGPDAGAFHHHLFQRDQPDLCVQMVCQKSSSSSRNGDDGHSKKQQRKTERHRQSKKKKRQLVVDVTPNSCTSCNLAIDNDIQLHEKDNKKRGLAITRTTLPPKKRRPPPMTMDYDLSSTTADTLSGVSTDTVPSLDTSRSSSFTPSQPKTYSEYSASTSHCMNHSLSTSSPSSHHLSSLSPQVPSSSSSMSSLSDGISANPASNNDSSLQVTTIHEGPNASFPTRSAVFQPSVNYFNFIRSTQQTLDPNSTGTVANGVAPVLSSLLHANPGLSITQQQNSSQQLSPNNAIVSSALQNIMPSTTTTIRFLLASAAPTVNTQQQEEQRPPPSFSLHQPSQNIALTKPKEDSSLNNDITTTLSTSQTNQVTTEVGTKVEEEQERQRLIHAQTELYRAFLSALMA